MKYFAVFVILAAITFIATEGRAAAVIDVSTLNALRTGAGSGATSVNVDGYSATNDGGGGQFVKDILASCTDDDGVVIKETATNICWFRQFSGPVHLRWYGVKDATSSGCLSNRASCAADDPTGFGSAIARAFTASSKTAGSSLTGLGGDGGVVTDGRSIVINNANLTIPPQGYLDCGSPPENTVTGATFTALI